jgi:hypothetical protein
VVSGWAMTSDAVASIPNQDQPHMPLRIARACLPGLALAGPSDVFRLPRNRSLPAVRGALTPE